MILLMKLISKDRNMPWTRSIENIDEYYPGVLPNIINLISKIKLDCLNENKSKRKQKKIIHQKLKEEYNNLSLNEIEQRVNFPGSVTIALNHSKILRILKKKKKFISNAEIITIVSDLMNGISYVAQHGFEAFGSNKKYELIELDDFNFKYDSNEDLKHVITILQILDSDFYRLEKLEDFYSGKWYHRDSFFEELKEKKFIQVNEESYLYLDTKIFTEMDRLPEDYPNNQDLILRQLSV